jgi:16S rRNA (uracil1498-N3)-methyltransferase
MAARQRLVVSLDQCDGEQLQLTAEQYHYLVRVLRLQVGAQFIAILAGQWWLTELTAEPHIAQLLEVIPFQTELPILVTLLAALPKGNGFEQVISQATELGVTKIQPVMSARTLLQPSTHKLERWQRLAQEAAEQCLRQTVPHLCPPIPVAEVWHQVRAVHRYICVPDQRYPSLQYSLNAQTLNAQILNAQTLAIQEGEIVIATGPEGGWTEAEVAMAIQAGFKPVQLGTRVLRAVTAPVVALALVAAHLEQS